eukprot:6294811-Prymnesium_polylepis.1
MGGDMAHTSSCSMGHACGRRLISRKAQPPATASSSTCHNRQAPKERRPIRGEGLEGEGCGATCPNGGGQSEGRGCKKAPRA